MKRMLLTAAAAAALGLASMSGAHAADSQQGTVHSITLPTDAPTMPDGPGKDAMMANCVLCHTPRYILIQPAFTLEKWKAEVNKMRTTYGAPIAPEKVDDIADYLVSVRGKPSAPASEQK